MIAFLGGLALKLVGGHLVSSIGKVEGALQGTLEAVGLRGIVGVAVGLYLGNDAARAAGNAFFRVVAGAVGLG